MSFLSGVCNILLMTYGNRLKRMSINKVVLYTTSCWNFSLFIISENSNPKQLLGLYVDFFLFSFV